MSLTGLVLYIVPEGRVAYWIIWKFAWLTRTEWSNIHILSSILFVVAGAFHIYFNWKTLLFYFRDKVAQSIRLRRELAISGLMAVWIVVSSLLNLPPLSYLLDLNNYVKSAWVTNAKYEPPFGHAELLSLKIFSKKMDINLESAVTELRTLGIEFDNFDETLESIARKNNRSPMEIYMLIKKYEPLPLRNEAVSYTPESIEYEFAGSNLGNRTIAAICEKTGLSVDTALSRLAAAGISATGNLTLKEIAAAADSKPIEILKAMLINKYTPVDRDTSNDTQ
jgi:hypothetical protein